MAVTISACELPTIDRVGLFPLLNPVFDFTYRNPTNAVHLYDYHGRVRVNSEEYVSIDRKSYEVSRHELLRVG